MKTNHRRGFVAKPHKDQAMFATRATAPIANKSFCTSIGNDFSKGNRGMAKAKRGAKKFVRSRIRFHDNTTTKRLASGTVE
ncbi:MAG: hypothetical protein AAB421_02240 [Patescibacteria group bacterium]